MIREQLAGRLKYFRERAGLTIYEAGEIIGKSGKTISAWENRRGQPDADMLLALCDLYRIDSIAELYGEPAPRAALSDPEKYLVGVFSELNEEGREEFLNYAAYLSAQDRYKKVHTDSVVDKAQ